MFVLQLEPALQRFFGQWGMLISRSPWRIIGPMVAVLIAISFGLFALERENDPIELWIADRGRIKDEVSFYRDGFEELSPNLQALIVQPREGNGDISLLDPRALEEVVELQDWIMQYEYVYKASEDATLQVTLGDICFKPVDRDDREPCFQYSILDCFREGNVFTPGGTRNSAYSGIYSPSRPSFSTFDFKETFTEEYIRNKCVQWYNLGTADTMFLGGITKGNNSKGESTVVDVEALRIVFGTKSEERLVKDGVKKIVWTPKTATGASGLDLCRDASDCVECSEEVGLADAAAAGCIPRPGAQSESCCTFMAELRDVECVFPLFEEDPSLANLANIVFEGCGIPTVQLAGTCSNEEWFLEEAPEAKRLAQEAEDSATDAPPVCICLVDRESEECKAEATNFATANIEYAPIFSAAQNGDTAALQEVRDLLLSPEVGCPAEDSAKSNAGTTPKEGPPPEVCICLTESGSPECQAAGLEFVGENPEYSTPFFNAAEGNETAVQEVGRILAEDLNCPIGGERRRKLLQANDEGDGPLQVCACLEDSTGTECAEGGVAFVQANPKYADTFKAAREGDAAASLEVARIIQEEGNCEETKYSFKVERTNFRNEDRAWDLLHGWEKAWRRDIKKQVKKFKYIDVSWVSSSSVTDETEKAARGQVPLITAGYIMVGVYIFLYFMLDFDGGIPNISHSPPGPFIAIVGYVCVLLSVAATFGIIGILSLSPMKTSPITLQIVPLLMVGLGVNDFFVIASYMKSSVLNQSAPILSKLLYDTMAGGGTSITLSSLTNMAAFALGSLSPIPAVQWFSIHMMIGVFVAYCVSITIIPAILTIGASRYLDAKNDCCLLCLGEPKVGASATKDQTPAGSSVPGERTARLLTVIIFAVFGAWLGISIWGITRLELGLPASQLVQRKSDLYKFLKPSEEHFQTFPIYTVYPGGNNLGKLQTVSDIRATEYNFTINAYKMDKYYRATSWVNYYAEYVESKFCSNTICMDQVEWFWDGFFSEEYGTEDVCKGLAGGKKACKQACSQRCPQGPVGSKFRCNLANKGKSCFCPYRPKLKEDFFFESPEGYSGSPSYWSDFMTNSTGGSISKNLIVFDESTRNRRNIFGIPAGFRSLSIVENVDTIDEKVRHINSGRKVTDRGPIEGGFPFDFLVYGVAEQYKDLGVKAAIAIAISIAVTLIVMMPLIVHWLAAVIVAACVLSAVVLTAGTSHWFGIGLNHSLYVSLVVTVGLSIEFCAHIARDFMLAEGTTTQRVKHALYSLGFAVFNGGITTFLGILPLSWAKYNYFQRYFFGLYALVVVVGLFVGLFLMPAVLYWLGPKSRHTAAKVNAGDEHGMEMVAKGKPGTEA